MVLGLILVAFPNRIRQAARECAAQYAELINLQKSMKAFWIENLKDLLKALAVTHCELVLIHPFREGNGRLSRLLSQLLALQAGMPLLNFSSIKGKRREEYFAAVRTSMERDYTPMIEVFRRVVKTSG
ncbi:MAG: Fic/DOC family protein [Candidatus Nitrotoga sp. CP45]|nr:MAG: Fic/DOC family protein [Candidatus Nitrotoga sp. CP45]